jgi:predicted 3-demethylubiquinone-9 3-methyltransferase (glyoxalase superfamily)
MQTIQPCLWFDDNAEEAARFYTSTFDRGRVGSVSRYDEASARVANKPEGSVLTVDFEVEGYAFTALNGGPAFTLNPSLSFFVDCPTDGDVEALWDALSEGGTALMPLDAYPFNPEFGWIQDRFGVSWQLALAPDRTDRRIRPYLMYVNENAGKAEAAVRHYASVFRDAGVGAIERYGDAQDLNPADMVAFAEFTLEGQAFVASENGFRHDFDFDEAISLQVFCDDQEQIDAYWEGLSAVPDAERCGWCKDRWGVSWQIVPKVLPELLAGSDPAGAKRAMEAMLAMKKLDIAALQAAYEGRS